MRLKKETKKKKTSIKADMWVSTERHCFILLRIDQAALHVQQESNFSASLKIQQK